MDPSSEQRRPDEATDADLIARVLDGDTQQFACLVTRYQRALFRHAAAMVLDHDAAADMVQDTFVRAYTKLTECRDRTRFRAWLFQTLRHRCLDYLKEAARRRIPLEDAGQLVDTADGPGVMVERHQLRTEIRRALAALPPDQREAFVMHYVDGMPYETMTELLDASVSALKMRAMRAREALSSALRRNHVTREPPASSLYQTR